MSKATEQNDKIATRRKSASISKMENAILKTAIKLSPRSRAGTFTKPVKQTGEGIANELKAVKHRGTEALGSLIHKNSSTGITNDEIPKDEDDLARSKYMMKSIAGLLTTASVYAGMDNAENVNDLAQDHENMETAEEPHPIETDDVAADLTEKDELHGLKLEKRRPTLFEFSVVTNQSPSDTNEEIVDSPEFFNKMVSDKLQKRFNLDSEEMFIYESSAWLLRDVLIQGHIFITSEHLLFYASLPKITGTTQLTGNLNIKSKIKGSSRYWCILKGTLLSLFNSPTEVYFPVLTIDLSNVTDIELEKDPKTNTTTCNFRISTNEKTFKFIADSEFAAKTWYNTLKRQHFATENMEDNSVSLKIPLPNILELDEEEIINQSVTMRLRALESKETYAIDDYIFMFLDCSGTLLKDALLNQLQKLNLMGMHILYNDKDANLLQDSVAQEESKENTSKPHKHSLLRSPLKYTPSRHKFPLPEYCKLESNSKQEKNTKRLGRLRSKSEHWLHKPTCHDTEIEESLVLESYSNQQTPVESPKIEGEVIGSPLSQNTSNSSENEVITTSTRREKLSGLATKPFKNMAEMWSAKPLHYQNEIFKFKDNSVITGKDCIAANKNFKEHFKVGQEETLISSYFTYLNRNIPVYGKLYLSDKSLCYRSLVPKVNTRMVLPIVDIETCYQEKSFRFGYFILVLVIRGHEELFFEFSSKDARDDIESLLSRRIDHVKEIHQMAQSNKKTSSIQTDRDNADLRFFEDKISGSGFDVPIMIDRNPYFKTIIKPNKKYNFGLLTIGSRGDVQPYIALGKALIKDGHSVTIITHSEFREFVERHGIQFKEIAGNPAELMSLMVEHESINIAMLRDASSHFRGWITELLQSSWDVCKNANFDILIESPSAMAGIHIAEALSIPYFRAFTMPWTRTRAYPHAFIVPDQKRGGNYNYLTHVLFENVFWRGISSQVNKWRVETLNLEKTNLELLQQNKVPFLYNISPTIFPPSIDFSEWVKVTGYWFLDEESNYTPPDDLLKFINKARKKGKKLVYIGFGSIVVSNAKEMTKALVEAVIEADVYCILNKGWSERLGDTSAKEIEIELPDCVFNAGAVPHDWLFPRVDAAVHHGGSGTTGASMRCGLPTIIKPFFGDQFFYANRVEDIGAGIALRKFNSKTLAKALIEVTTNEKMRERARLIKSQIAKEDGVQTAISCIFSELEYARSLIVNKRKKDRLPISLPMGPITNVANGGISTITGVLSSVSPAANVLEDSWILL